MSLVGSSPDESSQTARAQSKALFDDERTPGTGSNASLFADDTNASDSSPWGMPTPKKGARTELVKNLLSATDVPESYVDAYDAVLDSGDRTGSGISVNAATKVLQSTKISATEQARLLQLVAPPGTGNVGLGRSEFNVLLALIGLSQEDDEATLDGVDERRKSKCTFQFPYRASHANATRRSTRTVDPLSQEVEDNKGFRDPRRVTLPTNKRESPSIRDPSRWATVEVSPPTQRLFREPRN